ncbi:carbohydrate ABC transporter permease [Paenibacillus sp. V4I5]|uniref:carbohydrate ABC transporter permease n=1 Tax=Paenibacillus sp. V4I5 TaxID=3042306 RepID=UPI00278E90A5|nr:sugar ABC transporter permease [Paenibacillus sp. V4I5]MDQ0916189.1 multiple sugar transport system permease protein [Paenibacillus sp. V4I5]
METSIETGLQSVKVKRRITISWMPIIFLIPSLVCFLLFKYYPLFKMIYISLFDYEIGNPPGTFVGLNNYVEFLSSPSFWHAIEITFVFALMYLLMTFWVPIVQALLLNEIHHGNMFIRFLYQLPSAVPVVVNVLIWRWMYNPDHGILNYYLGKIGLGPYLWLNDLHVTKFAIVLPSLIASQGIAILLYYSAIRSVPTDILEAAKVDGAGPWKRLLTMILPNMRFIIFIQLISFMTGILLTFDNIYVMTQGGPADSTTVVSMLVFNTAFQQFRFGASAAISVFLFILIGLITFIQLKVSNDND